MLEFDFKLLLNRLDCTMAKIQIKLSENKLIIRAFVHLHYQISREKFEPEPGLKLGPPDL